MQLQKMLLKLNLNFTDIQVCKEVEENILKNQERILLVEEFMKTNSPLHKDEIDYWILSHKDVESFKWVVMPHLTENSLVN